MAKKRMDTKIFLGVLAMIVLANPANALSATYAQDGSPYLANGTATSAISYINTYGGGSYNITEAFSDTKYSDNELVQNGAFAGGSNANWLYQELDPSNRASSAFLSNGGDGEPGRWRFTLNDNSNAVGFTANGNLTNDGTSWDGSTPSEALLNFSFYKNYNTAPTADVMSVYLLRPDGSQILLWSDATVFTSNSFSRASISIPANYFSQAGVYRVRLFNYVVTPASGRPSVNNYWDEVSLSLKKPQNYYSLGVWHNSSSIAVPSDLAEITEINLSLRLMADSAITPTLEIFNFASGTWENNGCSPGAPIAAGAWTTLFCDITSTPQNYISADSNKKIRMRLFTADTGTSQANVSEDWLEYLVYYTPAVVQAYVAADKADYSACGLVYYRARFLDKDEQLYTPSIQANISVSNSSSILGEKTVSVAGGIHQDSFLLPPGSNPGNWLIRALSGALGKKIFHVRTGNSDVWKINLLFNSTRGAYSSAETAGISFTVFSLKGIGIPGLQPESSLLLSLDGSPFSPAIQDHSNGTYSFTMDFSPLAAGAHSLQISANSSNVNVTASSGFLVS